MNLTDKQKDLLRALVSNHETNGGVGFIFLAITAEGKRRYQNMKRSMSQFR